MLYTIESPQDQYSRHLTEDPVRPHIPVETRFGKHRTIFAEIENDSIGAITCVSFTSTVPADEIELFQNCVPTIAVFYTIWSYQRGSARRLLFNVVEHCKQQNIQRFVTLSPVTEMAHKFHTNNGAIVLRKNSTTVNYEYIVKGFMEGWLRG